MQRDGIYAYIGSLRIARSSTFGCACVARMRTEACTCPLVSTIPPHLCPLRLLVSALLYLAGIHWNTHDTLTALMERDSIYVYIGSLHIAPNSTFACACVARMRTEARMQAPASISLPHLCPLHLLVRASLYLVWIHWNTHDMLTALMERDGIYVSIGSLRIACNPTFACACVACMRTEVRTAHSPHLPCLICAHWGCLSVRQCIYLEIFQAHMVRSQFFCKHTVVMLRFIQWKLGARSLFDHIACALHATRLMSSSLCLCRVPVKRL